MLIDDMQAFLDGERTTRYLANETKNEILLCAATEITDRYYELAADLVSVVRIQTTLIKFLDLLDSVFDLVLLNFDHEQARKTESSLQKIRQSAQRRAGASSDISDNYVSDTDKICMQLFLDIKVWHDTHYYQCDLSHTLAHASCNTWMS